MAAVEAMPMAACDQQLETVMLLEPRPFRPFKSSEEYLYAMKEDLADWLNHLYELSITVDDFMEKLETGVVLCQHANHVRQLALEHHRAGRNGFSVPIPHREVVYRQDVAAGTFHARDNVSNFIAWCRSLGIYECLLFETDDLVLRKNEKSFILCLLEVARRGAKFGMPAPLLVQMEEEIDREIAKENEKSKNGTSGDDYDDADNGLDPPIQIITNDLKSLDEMVRDLVNRCTCPVQFPMIRVSEGKYRIGDTQMLIFVRILRSHVMVRVGGGWDTLEHYLDKHDPCRCRLGHRTTVSSKLMVKHSPYNFANPQMQVTYERSPEPFRVGGTTSSPQSGGSGSKTSLSTPGSPQRIRRASNSSNPSLASKSSTGSLASTGSDKEQKQSSSETKTQRPNSDTYLSTATFLPTDMKSASGLHVSRYYFGGEGTPVSTVTDRTFSTSDLTTDEGYQSGSRAQTTPNLKAPRKILGGTAEDVSGERPDSRLTVGSSDCGSLEDPSLHKRDSLLDSPDSPVGVLEEEPIPNDGGNLNHNHNNNVSNHIVPAPPPIGSAIPKRSKIPFLDSSASLRPSARKKSQSSENLGGVELLAAMQAEALGMNPATVVKTRHLSGERGESPGRNTATKQPHGSQSSSMTRSRSQGGETGNDMAAYMSRNTLGRYSYRNPRPDPSPATRIPKTGVNRTWACRTRDARPSLSPDLFSRPPPARHTPNKSPSPQRRSLPTGGTATPKGSPTRGANSTVHAGGPSRSLQSSPSRQQGPPLLQEVLTVAEDLSTDEQLIRKMEEILQQYKTRVEQNNRCSKGEDENDESQPNPRKSQTPTQSPRHRRRVSPSPIAMLPANEDGDNYTKHWVATTASRHRQRRASSASLGSPDSSSEAGDDAAAAVIRGGWSRENSNLGANNGNGGRSSRGSSRCTSPVPSLSGASIVTVGGSRIPVRVSPRRDSAPGGPTKIPVPTYYAS